MGNRWGNSGNSVRLYLGGAPKSLQICFHFLGLHIKGIIHCVPNCLTGWGCNALFPFLNIR